MNGSSSVIESSNLRAIGQLCWFAFSRMSIKIHKFRFEFILNVGHFQHWHRCDSTIATAGAKSTSKSSIIHQSLSDDKLDAAQAATHWQHRRQPIEGQPSIVDEERQTIFIQIQVDRHPKQSQEQNHLHWHATLQQEAKAESSERNNPSNLQERCLWRWRFCS